MLLRFGGAATLIFVVAGSNRVISFPIRSGNTWNVERFKLQLSHLSTVGVRVQRSICQQNWMFCWI
jgi:hypothetical protein